MMTPVRLRELKQKVHDYSNATLHGPIPTATTMQLVCDLGELLAAYEQQQLEIQRLRGDFDEDEDEDEGCYPGMFGEAGRDEFGSI